MTTTTFAELGLDASLLAALKEKNYTHPTPIQADAIPPLLEGRDLWGIAQTGTGKTAAFTLPILHHMIQRPLKVKAGRVRVLILTPTRELASQIEENLKEYAKQNKFKSYVIFGGVGHRPQVSALGKGLDFCIATPGRLLDLMGEGQVVFDQCEFLVLDEADRMLDMGFIRDIQKIIAKIPTNRQTLLFSATMPKDIVELSSKYMKNPVKVEVTPESTTVDKIEQSIHYIPKDRKNDYLIHLLKADPKMSSVLVFSRTKHGANKIVKKLEIAQISCAAIHGNKSQGARERALADFRAGKMRVLVATDIAARGIDIPLVGHVVNFDLPDDAKSYVHRIGRTARAQREGMAISFCAPEEMGLLKDIEKLIKLILPKLDTKDIPLVISAPAARGPNHRPVQKSNMPHKKNPNSSRPHSKKKVSKKSGPKKSN